MIKRLLQLIVCVATACASASSIADVEYSFTDLYSDSFNFIVPSYISTDSNIASDAFSDCVRAMGPCGNVHFFIDAYASGLTLTNRHVEAIGFSDTAGVTFFFYFDAGSFATVGVHKDSIFGDGTLTVSAVPEPTIAYSLIAGLGLLGFMMRRRNQQR